MPYLDTILKTIYASFLDVYKLFQYHDMLKALRHSKQFDKMRKIMHALQGLNVLDHNNDRLKGFRQSKFEIIFTIWQHKL